ncbi:hypothetical protein VLF92_02450 [Pseudomonas chengduensis]
MNIQLTLQQLEGRLKWLAAQLNRPIVRRHPERPLLADSVEKVDLGGRRLFRVQKARVLGAAVQKPRQFRLPNDSDFNVGNARSWVEIAKRLFQQNRPLAASRQGQQSTTRQPSTSI